MNEYRKLIVWFVLTIWALNSAAVYPPPLPVPPEIAPGTYYPLMQGFIDYIVKAANMGKVGSRVLTDGVNFNVYILTNKTGVGFVVESLNQDAEGMKKVFGEITGLKTAAEIVKALTALDWKEVPKALANPKNPMLVGVIGVMPDDILAKYKTMEVQQ
jgi:hypothetical protein